MNTNKKHLFWDFILHFVLFVGAFMHLLISLLRRFLPIKGFQPYDYIPGILVIVVAVPIFLYLIISCGKKYVRFRVGSLFLAALFFLYLLSCYRWSAINQVNEFHKNNVMLYDTFVLFFFIYPVGQYIARWKQPAYFRLFLNVVLLIASVFVLFVIVNVLHGRTIDVPSGTPICLKPTISVGKSVNRLEISCNANGTGSALSIAFLISLILVFRNTTIFGKLVASLYMLIHFIGLVLTGSRTAFSTTWIGSAFIIFFFIRLLVNTNTRKKIQVAAVASLLFLLITLASERWISSWPQLQTDPAAVTATTTYAVDVSDLSELSSRIQNLPLSEQTRSSFIHTVNTRMSSAYSSKLPSSPHIRAFRNSMGSRNTMHPAAPAADTPSPLYITLDRLLSGRLRVFGYAVQAINKSPDTRRYGVTPVHIFSAIKEIGGVSMYTHNQFLEVTLALGFPALFVFIGFLLYILFNTVRLFRYSKSDSIDLIIPIFLLTILMANMTEAFLMFHRCFASFIFFFLCGWVNERGVLATIHHRKTKKRDR